MDRNELLESIIENFCFWYEKIGKFFLMAPFDETWVVSEINLDFRNLYRPRSWRRGPGFDDYANAPSCASRSHETRMRPDVDKYLLM